MNRRALSTTARLLATACLSAALGTALTVAPGCSREPCEQVPDLVIDIDDQLVPATVDLRAVDRSGEEMVAVGSGGVILRRGVGLDWVEVETPTEADLEAVAHWDSLMLAVGAGGTVLRSADGGASWELVDIGATADLFALSFDESRGFIVGDGEIFYSSDGGETWAPATVPAEAGVLRGVFDAGEAIWAIGAGGTVLSSVDGGQSWALVDLGLDVDLWAVGYAGSSNYEGIFAVGDAGTVLRLEDGSWVAQDNELSGDLRGVGGNYFVGREGLIVAIELQGSFDLERFAIVADDPARGDLWDVVDATAVGDASKVSVISLDWVTPEPEPFCDPSVVPGRPLRVAGEARTAPLRERGDWLATLDRDGALRSAAAGLDGELRAELAARWSADGQLEHASVASFANFAVELLGLGAPAELIVAAQQAMADEIVHAKLCFALASAYAGRAIGPDRLVVAGLRPAATAEAVASSVFADGCVNETVAALEAAAAAEAAEEPRVRAVLARIAEDEARHAALAWRTLAWLARSGGAGVRSQLRARLAELGPLDPARAAAIAEDPGEEALARHGRLPASERREIQRWALATVVRPTLAALVDALEPAAAELG